MFGLLNMLTLVYSKSLPCFINALMIFVAIFRKLRLIRVVSILSVCSLIILVYYREVLQDFILHQSEGLLIIDAHNIDSCTGPVLELLTKSFIPNTSNAYNDEEDRLCAGLSENGFICLCNEYDPRLLPALWLSHISLKLERFNITNELKIPFSWNALLDLQSRLNIPHMSLANLSCGVFYELHKLDGTDFLKSCQDLVNESDGRFPFKIIRPVDLSVSEDARKIIGSSYLLHSAPTPEKVILLGVGQNGSSVIVPTFSLEENPSREIYNEFHYIRDRILASYGTIGETINIHKEANKLRDLLSLPITNVSRTPDKNLTHDIFRLVEFSDGNSKRLSKDDFFFHLDEFKSQLIGKIDLCSNENTFDSRMLSKISMDNSTQSKYFHEALILEEKGNHYDWRFFKQLHYSKYERKAILHRLSRAWLRFSSTLGIKSWIAHGSMLGWYWNGMSLPWDQDLDIQITMKSLLRIAKYYNQSLVLDLTDQDFNLNLGVGSYLLDVNSKYFDRQKGNGENTIDARFIDTETGFYVDITALAFTNTTNEMGINDRAFSEFNQVLDNDFVMKDKSHTILREDLSKSLSVRKKELWNHKNIFNCKDNHFYTLEDLDPLISTLFEGCRAYVPSRFKPILQREYNRGLLYYQYADHTFRPVLDLWVPDHICKNDYIGNKCFDKETLLEMEYTKPLTRLHRTEMVNQSHRLFGLNDELEPFRLDPWIIRRAYKIKRYLN